MLWLCVFLPRLSLEALAAPAPARLAVFERKGRQRRLIALGDQAGAGLHPGMAVNAALAIHPQLTLVERDPRREKQTLQSLAGWAEQFASELCIDPERQLLWLEIGGSLNYFGGLDALLQSFAQGLQSLGHHAQTGVAPTLEAAAWVALAGDAPILEPQQLPARLGHHPLQALPFPAAAEALADSGVQRLDALLRLPADGLARRFGAGLPDYLQRLLGRLPDARPRYRPPRSYRRRMEFLGAIESTEGLLFPIRRVLIEFQGHLRARDSGVQQFLFEFEHEGREATPMDVRLTAASRDAAHFLVIVRERLERLPLPAPVTGLRLRAERYQQPDLHQGDLFDQRLQQDSEWLGLLEKLQARLGPEAIRFLGLRAEHLPERSWHAGQQPAAAPDSRFPPRPFWLLARPQPLREIPPLQGRPERIAGGWWDGADAQRDYYLAEAVNGARLWVYREENRWFMHGLWA